ncbi:hypothetical protein QUW48_08795 [Bifidobacterium pullorum]|uniref:hypothetical protein n=1 Tax=Bifidobacterium pullorum TaxID=78448 RepID=UPI0025A465F4|nr:hypothetical protein [Bifidobacterium pullorum]MDM8323621.1 hypothetical protein [Bifidobacterium pullorum]
MKRFLYLLCALAFCLALTPSTALAAAPNGQVIYVGNENVTNGGYWTTSEDGQTITSVGDSQPSSGGYIHYDADNNTLTLHNATIKESVSTDTSTLIAGTAIGVLTESGDAKLTITLEGTNTIAEVSMGIYVLASSKSTGSASLTITGDGILSASSGSNSGIRVQSNTGNGTLTITGAKVTASSSNGGNGVQIRCGDGSDASLTVNGGSLTAMGSGTYGAGIRFQFGSRDYNSGMPSLTVSGNAMVKASGGEGGISTNSSTATEIKSDSEAASGGIVFDGTEGTVYGDVTLDESLTVNEGETLTIPEGSTLDTGGNNLTNDGIIVNTGGTLNGEPGGTIVSDPTITKQPESQTVAENATAKFTVEATGGNLSYQWQQNTDGTNWTDISGANSDTYTTEDATTDMNGRQYHCIVSNNAGSVTSNAATLTVNQHKHQWGEPAWTWSEDGKTATATFTCAECDETQNVKATVTPTVTTDPTCTGNGTTTYTATATLDGKDYTATKDVADIPATGHELTGVAAKAPTCTEDGYEAYWKCERCGRYFSDADGKNEIQAPTVIKATGHEWGEDGHCTICDTIKPGFTPEIIQGDEAIWTKGGGQPLSFTSNAAYADFQEARVDGQTLDPAHYTVEQGSTIVTLNAAYLETLDPGEHTLDIVSATGTATATFTITAKETQQPAKPADTDRTPAKSAGDGGQLSRGGSDIMPAVATLAILMASGLVLGTLTLRRGRR